MNAHRPQPHSGLFGWLRPARREFWRLVPWWSRMHKMMSTQALGLGTVIITVLLEFDYPKSVVMGAVLITAGMVLYGSLVEQPEVLDNEQADPE